jgi:hypothetical protein
VIYIVESKITLNQSGIFYNNAFAFVENVRQKAIPLLTNHFSGKNSFQE